MNSLCVRFVGPVRRPGPERVITVDVAGLVTIEDLLRHLRYLPHEWTSLGVLVDGVRRGPADALNDARTVEILVALGGG
jgi:hypothetical protein